MSNVQFALIAKGFKQQGQRGNSVGVALPQVKATLHIYISVRISYLAIPDKSICLFMCALQRLTRAPGIIYWAVSVKMPLWFIMIVLRVSCYFFLKFWIIFIPFIADSLRHMPCAKDFKIFDGWPDTITKRKLQSHWRMFNRKVLDVLHQAMIVPDQFDSYSCQGC